MTTYPTSSALSVAQLVASMATSYLRLGADRRQVLLAWIRREVDLHNTDAFVVNVLGKKFLLVDGSRLSAYILDPEPDDHGFVAGTSKTRGMSFLAPNALTISNGSDWRRRRDINEQVLCTGRPHDLRSLFHAKVRASFATSITSADDIRERMGSIMLGVVFGSDTNSDLPDQVEELMTYVYNPGKRAVLGRFSTRRKRSFYDMLRRLWASPGTDCLVSSFRATDAEATPENLEQIPHWMFTFTGSGADLLARTIALIGSRPEVRDRVLREIAQAGPLDDAETIDRLDYTEACLREAGRLFAPVTRTFHRAPHGAMFGSRSIPSDVEIVHYFPAGQRDTRADPTANDFVPERWMGPDSDGVHLHASIFMSGSRTCPAEDLILFLCKGAIAAQRNLLVHAPSLTNNPLPMTFPDREVRYLAPNGSPIVDSASDQGGRNAMTEPTHTLTEADLAAMPQSQLDALYLRLPETGAVPVGDTMGLALLLPSRPLGHFVRTIARILLWQGKVFDPQSQDLKNKVSPFGFRAIRAEVYRGPSWFDKGTDATVLDYSKTSWLARWIRDEIREVRPGLWLGKVFIRRWHVLDFSLTK
jgi:cytochrome P450